MISPTRSYSWPIGRRRGSTTGCREPASLSGGINDAVVEPGLANNRVKWRRVRRGRRGGRSKPTRRTISTRTRTGGTPATCPRHEESARVRQHHHAEECRAAGALRNPGAVRSGQPAHLADRQVPSRARSHHSVRRGRRTASAPQGAPAQPAEKPAPSVALETLVKAPDKYLNTRVRLSGTVENLGRNYFTDRSVALRDESGHTIAVSQTGVPTGLPPPAGREGRRPATLSDYLGKKVEVIATVQRREQDGIKPEYVLKIESIKHIE